jgi:uncharacterized protein YijF (DUF1287 family)
MITKRYNLWIMKRAQKQLDRRRKQLETLMARKKAKAITPAKFSAKKGELDRKIKNLDARVRKIRSWYK